jgi:hypothetical protein
MEKFLILISFYSRKIVASLIAIYFIVGITFWNKYEMVFRKFEIPVLFSLFGIYIGMSLMASIIKYLNKPSTKEHPTFKKLTHNQDTQSD